MRLNLRARKDLVFGPLQMEMQAGEVGEGAVDLRQRVLPACVQEKRNAEGRICSWASPMMLVPLNHVRGGVCGEAGRLGEAVAHVALVFSVDTNPEEILAAAGTRRTDRTRPLSLERTFEEAGRKIEEAERKLEQQMASTKQSIGEAKKRFEERGTRTLQAIGEAERKLEEHVNDVERQLTAPVARLAERVEKLVRPSKADAAAARAAAQSRAVAEIGEEIPSPDVAPDGWVCKLGPSGQAYWHHQVLGPAPWETSADAAFLAQDGQRPATFTAGPPNWQRVSDTVGWLLREASGPVVAVASGVQAGRPCVPRRSVPSPDEAPDGWVFHQGADGRTFWHHQACGPAPWDSFQAAGAPGATSQLQRLHGCAGGAHVPDAMESENAGMVSV